MPIASKLLYFQRRPSPAPPDPDPDPPDPRRRACRDSHQRRRRSSSSLSSSSSSHHKPGQEILQFNQRDAANKPLGSAGNTTEHVAVVSSSARLNRSVSDHTRLPDAVQQARERLLQRLNSVDLSGRRQKTWPSDTFWAGSTRPADAGGVSTPADNILASLTNCFQPGEPVAARKVEESATAEAPLAGNSDDQLGPVVTLFSGGAVPESQRQEVEEEEAAATVRKKDGAEEGGATTEPPPAAESECSICLERCGGGGVGGLARPRCGHVFHSACLERWLRSRGDCPYCRASVLL